MSMKSEPTKKPQYSLTTGLRDVERFVVIVYRDQTLRITLKGSFGYQLDHDTNGIMLGFPSPEAFPDPIDKESLDRT